MKRATRKVARPTSATAKPAGAKRSAGKASATPTPKAGRRKDDPARPARILGGLDQLYPDAECALRHADAFQLLVATILSAQCTDVRVNMVTPELFARYPTPDALAAAKPADLEAIIRSTGFYHNKAKSLLGMSRALVERHGGKVPQTMAELLELPGVARKTANVVLGTAFGQNEGVVVDTHIFRLAHRLGLARGKNPVEVERELMKRFPRESWTRLGHELIWHGRRICVARKPRCRDCALAPDCPSAELD